MTDTINLHSGFSAELRTLTSLLLIIKVPKLTYTYRMVSWPLLLFTWEKSLIIPAGLPTTPAPVLTFLEVSQGSYISLAAGITTFYQNRSHSVNEPLVVVKLDQRRASLVRICLFQIFGASQHRVTLDSPNSFVLALMLNQKISFCNVSLCYLYLDLFVFFFN